MPGASKTGGRFEVHCSGMIAKDLKQIQQQAKLEGRGEQAIQAIWHELSHDPDEFGEPLYHLPSPPRGDKPSADLFCGSRTEAACLHKNGHAPP